MNKKVLNGVLATALIALVISVTSLPAHAQPTIDTRPDKSAYAPGDSGTMTITIFNNANVGQPLAVRNITVYYPWAGYDTNGKWISNANFTNTFSPPMALATTGATNFSYTTPQFSIPSWWGFGSTPQFPACSGQTRTLGRYSACILVGTNVTGTNRQYFLQDFNLVMAQPFYNPSSTSILQTWVPVANLVVLIVATAILAMIMLRSGSSKKSA